MCDAMQAHQEESGRLGPHARYHCGGTCGYDVARRYAAILAASEGDSEASE